MVAKSWNAGTLTFANPHLGPAGRRCRRGVTEGVWRRCLRRHPLFTCLKNCSSERSSVPVRRRPRRIALKTCANEVSGDYRFCILEHSPAQRVFQPVPAFQQGVRSGGERRRRALGAATCGFEPHGRWESIGAAAERWGGPGGPAPAAGTVGCSSVPFRSRLFQCARIGFGGKEATLDPGSSTNRRAIGFCVDCGTDHQSPAGRAAGRWEGRGSARTHS